MEMLEVAADIRKRISARELKIRPSLLQKFVKVAGVIAGKGCDPWERGASRPHKTWQGRGDWLHRVGRFTCRLAPGQRLYKNAGGTPAVPRGKPMAGQVQI